MEGERVVATEAVDVAVVVERSSGSDALLSGSRVGAMEFMSEHELLTQASAGWVGSYSVGVWTSAYNAS